LSPVNCKLTRKTYTVWDLSPEEFENLLEQEKALQKRKRNLDYFLRRRAKKTKELLPLEGYEKKGLFSDTHNNLGCLFSNDVCTQDEICFDDLILGRCISADLGIDEDEELQPLSSDDQSLLDAEVERLLEQGFRWDDPYTQCVLQTLINSFQFYGLEYDTTLCKAAFLPEVLVERRVDVPKKFLIPNGEDIDASNNNNNQKRYDESSIDNIIGDNQLEEKPFSTSTNEDKRSTVINKRSQNANDDTPSFLIPPSAVFDNDAYLINPPIIDEPQVESTSEDDDSDDEVVEINNDENNDSGLREVDLLSGPRFHYPPINFFVHQEEDGGILIEPDHVSPSSASTRVNQDQSIINNIREEDEEDYNLPTFVFQPSIPTSDQSSLPIQIPFNPQEEQLANLIWMANNIHEPYLDENDDTLNDLGIIPTLQQQQNPIQFHPTIWFDDEISLPSEYDDNLDDLSQFIDLEDIEDKDADSGNINYQVRELL
jgi:hypothetical protein